MGLWSYITKALSRSAIHFDSDGQSHSTEHYSPANFRSFVDLAYKRNEVVYACLNKIASSFPAAPFAVRRPGTINAIPDHELSTLFRKPNGFMSEFEFFELSILYLYLSGSCFWEKVFSASGRVVELWPLRPDKVSIVVNLDGVPIGYLYRLDGEDIPIALEDMVHTKFPDPLNPYFGLSPLQALSRQICQDNEATDFAWEMFENRAVPGVIVETLQELDEDKAKKYRARYQQLFGRHKRGSIAFMQKGMTIHTLDQKMGELGFSDLRGVSESRICGALDVSPLLISMKVGLDKAAYSSFSMLLQNFWLGTIRPLQKRWLSEINTDEDFIDGGKVEAFFDDSDVPALIPLRRARLTHGVFAFSTGLLNRNRALALAGLPLEPDPKLGSEYVPLQVPQQMPVSRLESDSKLKGQTVPLLERIDTELDEAAADA